MFVVWSLNVTLITNQTGVPPLPVLLGIHAGQNQWTLSTQERASSAHRRCLSDEKYRDFLYGLDPMAQEPEELNVSGSHLK
jgi:hypothetical protein